MDKMLRVKYLPTALSLGMLFFWTGRVWRIHRTRGIDDTTLFIVTDSSPNHHSMMVRVLACDVGNLDSVLYSSRLPV